MNFSKLFTHKKDLIYLNSGSLARTPRSVVDAVKAEIETVELNPTTYLFGAWERMWEAQQSLARILKSDPINIYLRPNVTQAMNDFLMTVPLGKTGEIVVSNLEYGAIVNVCRRRAEVSGLGLRSIDLPLESKILESLTAEILYDKIVSQLNNKTQMLMLSHVITGNGMILPIERIGQFCRDKGIVFAVDGAHGPGALPLDFGKLESVDFYGGNVHKWLMGSKGTGFGWIHPRWHSEIFPTQFGWTTYESIGGFATFAPESRFAGRFLTSNSIDFAPYFALPALEKFWTANESAIRERLAFFKHRVHQLAKRLDWPLVSPTHDELAGPLYSFDIPDRLQPEGYNLMMRIEKQYGLMVSTPPFKGRHLLRISPHIYNSESDLEQAFEIISKL